MPSHMPSSFASAAAGQAAGRDSRGNGRGETRGSVDWPRRENRGPNGTVTLRRSSTTPHGASMQQFSQADISTGSDTGFGQLQQQYTNQGTELISEGGRFSKDKLLEIYKAQQNSDELNSDVTRLFMNNWDPAHSNGINGRGWGKSNDARDQSYGPEACWDQNGQIRPISLEEMSEQERMVFSGDVNSPLKPPPQSGGKDQSAPGSANGRKTSISQGQGGATSFGLASPTAARPSVRRRETSDSIPYSSLASPGATSKFNRDEPSPFFTRKSTDFKDGLYGTSGTEDRPVEDLAGSVTSKMNLPFGGLIRGNTAGTTALSNGPASPWGASPVSAKLSPMGNFGNFAMPGQQAVLGEKRTGFGTMRGGSRLVSLMPRDSAEELGSKPTDANKGQESSKPWRSRPRADTDPFGDDLVEAGQDINSLLNQQHKAPGIDTPPTRQISSDLGMSDVPGFRDSTQRRDEPQQTPQGHHGIGNSGCFSPTDTNPYGSPASAEGDEIDHAHVASDTMQHMGGHGPISGISDNGPNHYGALSRGLGTVALDESDRSQNSSAGASKPFSSLSGLSGLGGFGGWPTTSNSAGTPDRERPNFQGVFGNTIFGPMGEMQSPGLATLGGTFSGSSGNLSGTSTIGRGSKLGSLFPAAMQAQMQGAENEVMGDHGDHRQSTGFGAIGRNAIGSSSRGAESPMRSSRGVFDDLLQASEPRSSQGPISSAEVSQSLTSSAPHTAPSYAPAPVSAPYQQPSQASSDAPSNSLPPSQQRTMVMPDRMRWVYLDPQGQVQGPWSGLEMHDWYKASFFTADLSVKKVEDADFEPLGQLIRRIGNSREPFLVPQIGVPHGPATTQAGAPFAPAAAASGAPLSQQGSVQPPFAGAFPSFGTTLTAEQQNNLERRKQEEQYLMARQREFLAQQQQVTMKQMQMQGAMPSALHHHSSAHSLQSQPSFGSITSPIGIQPQAPIPGAQGVAAFFDGVSRQPGGPAGMALSQDFLREEEFARLSIQERQQAYGPGIAGLQLSQVQPLPSMLPPQQHPDVQRDAARMEQHHQIDPQGFKARLHEFKQLRAQHDLEQSMHSSTGTSGELVGQPQQRSIPRSFREKIESHAETKVDVPETEVLSLTEQVQKAASAKQTPAAQPESPWGKVATGLPMPFPPPQSATPLPAPTALRSRSNLPEALNMGSRSRSETPDIPGATPSIAPWAKEQAEAPKGPSLKEIQEAEAKKAAKVEEAAAAARRALFEQEMRNQPVSQAPGLPATSTWAGGASPATSSATSSNLPSAWAKSVMKSQSSTTANPTSKKTLADIQKEEELRKQKLAAASAATAMPGQSGTSGGKRYADLAGKPTSSSSAGSTWSTVGAGGKIKPPSGPSVSTPATNMRSITTTALPTASSSKVTRPTAVGARSVAGNGSTGQSGITTANQEFTKWAKNELSKGLNSGINVDEFVRMLSDFPAEPAVIADSVYANSQLMDGRRFADEFLRRKKLADKGVVEGAPVTGDSKGSGGWSEVAKKGPPKEEPTTGFKVVPNKKKGRK